jgi:hypothetical protein
MIGNALKGAAAALAACVVLMAGCGDSGGDDEGGAAGSGALQGSGGSSGLGGSGGGATNTSTSNLGKACDTDVECGAGLTCHLDSVDYMVHRQCSTYCSSSADCQSAFGANSTCIGANLCVANCASDADCGPSTHCNDLGWCERSGPGSGNPYCAGVPTPCSALTEQTCYSQLGCSPDGQCDGISSSCYAQFTSYSCDTLDGCYWSSYYDDCSGVSWSCNMYTTSSSCTGQDGCNWAGSCTGTPLETSCGDVYPSLCSGTPGCTLMQ